MVGTTSSGLPLPPRAAATLAPSALDAGTQHRPWRQGAPRQPVDQDLPLEVLHHDEVDPVLGVDVVDGADVGVVQRGQRPGLELESRHPIGVRGVRPRQHLERHVALEPGVARPVDLTHPAGADRGEHRVVTERGAGLEGHDPPSI